jgi:hypothetical protein
MDINFIKGKTLLVGAETTQIATLKRDILLYDGFVDEEFGEDYPELQKKTMDTMSEFTNGKIDFKSELYSSVFKPMQVASELSSLGLLKSFSDLGIDSHDLNLEAAISGITSVSDSLGMEKSPSYTALKTFNTRHINTVENEIIYKAATRLTEMGANAIPRFKHLPSYQSPFKSSVINIVLDKFPCPSGDMSVAQILDFKSDEDSIRKLGSLNVLIARLARENTNPLEISQEIDQLILEAKSVLKARKVAYKESKLTKVFRISEAVFKGNLGELLQRRDREKAEIQAKSELKMTVDELSLMETEIASEWKHIAYLIKAESLANK